MNYNGFKKVGSDLYRLDLDASWEENFERFQAILDKFEFQTAEDPEYWFNESDSGVVTIIDLDPAMLRIEVPGGTSGDWLTELIIALEEL
jgi:hypothetical protein